MRSTVCRFGAISGLFDQQGTPRARVPPLFCDWLKCTPQHSDCPASLVPLGFQGFFLLLMGLHFEGGRQILEKLPPLLEQGGLADLSGDLKFGVNCQCSHFVNLRSR